MTGFFQQIYIITSKIPKGKVSTYGAIARAVGSHDARRVGHALHANKSNLVPCHRVVFSNGLLAPGYAFGGPDAQKKKLVAEGIDFTAEGKVDLRKFFFQFGDLKHSKNISD